MAKGNVLGAPRAESDRNMLSQAFYKSDEFFQLSKTNDFNYVVGRRGAGKSALFAEVGNILRQNKGSYVFMSTPDENEMLAMNALLENKINDYKIGRALSKLAWEVHIIAKISESILRSYKVDNAYLAGWLAKHATVLKKDSVYEILAPVLEDTSDLSLMPKRMVEVYDIKNIEEKFFAQLTEAKVRSYFLIDSVDEGWEPKMNATANIGGLATLASKFAEKSNHCHLCIYIRDNIFRALTFFDPDSSRNFEGNTLRINWDANKLFELVTARIRMALNLQSLENNKKVWNRFVTGSLRDMDGFEECLKSTLYRPRDLINLLNAAFRKTGINGGMITKEQLDEVSVEISEERFRDLQKEYDEVLPGLKEFCEAFRASPARMPYTQALEILENVIDNTSILASTSDFHFFENSKTAFYTLYSVGFVGGLDSATGKFVFCHDGSHRSGNQLVLYREIMVHPCFWRALDITELVDSYETLLQINDDYTTVDSKAELTDVRLTRIGKTIANIADISVGSKDAHRFEQWVYDSFRILFGGVLSNIELKANKNANQRRDIIATVEAECGFWSRVLKDYKCRQLVIEVKNFTEIGPDEFRQMLSYSGNQYGNFGIIVTRGQEGLTAKERSWTQEMWHEHKKLFMMLPDTLIRLYLRKIRGTGGAKKVEKLLGRRLDTYLRSYVNLKSPHRNEIKR